MPRERTAIWVGSPLVGVANVIITIAKVIWCCSGPISAFRTLQQEIHPWLNYMNTTAIMIITYTEMTLLIIKLYWPASYPQDGMLHCCSPSKVIYGILATFWHLAPTICFRKPVWWESKVSTYRHNTHPLWYFSIKALTQITGKCQN